MNKYNNIKPHAINQIDLLTMNFYDSDIDIEEVKYLKRDGEVWLYDARLVKKLTESIKVYYVYKIDLKSESLVITNILEDVLGIIPRFRDKDMEQAIKEH